MEIRLYIIHHVDVCFVSKTPMTFIFGKKLLIKMILPCMAPFLCHYTVRLIIITLYVHFAVNV